MPYHSPVATTVEQIKEKLSIVDVVSGYVELKRAGLNYKARCPFHSEKSPSFTLSPERGTYHCFGCGVGGDMFTFIETIEGIDFKGALKILADKAGVEIVYERGAGKEDKDAKQRLYELIEAATIFFQRNLADKSAQYDYVLSRGITAETIQKFRLGWAPSEEVGWRTLTLHLKDKGFSEAEVIAAGLAKMPDSEGANKGAYDRFRSRIMFPMGDTAGRIIAFSGRIFGQSKDSEAAKYINSPESELFHKAKVLYGYDRAKQTMRKLDCAILVEGQMDLVMSHQAGWTNTVAVSGTALTADHVTLLKRMTNNLILALDSDDAGIAAAQKSAHLALGLGMDVKVVAVEGGKDPADIIKEKGSDAWKDAVKSAQPVVFFLLDVLKKRAVDDHAFVKAVEATVLPFIVEMPSVLDRDFFTRETSKRTGIPERVLAEAVQKVPRGAAMPARAVQGAATSSNAPQRSQSTTQSSTRSQFGKNHDPLARARQVFGLLLWQESLQKKEIDTDTFRTELKAALGDIFDTVSAGTEEELEVMRFKAEGLYGGLNIAIEAHELLRALLREKLGRDLQVATAQIKQAEAQGDDAALAHAMAESQRLALDIAKLDKVG